MLVNNHVLSVIFSVIYSIKFPAIRCLALALSGVGLVLSHACVAGSVAAVSGYGEWVGTNTIGRIVWKDSFPARKPEELIRIVVSLNVRNKPTLDALTSQILANQSAPRLGKEEFLRNFAPTVPQANYVADYLRAYQFDHVTIAENRLLISALGSLDVVEKAFNTRLTFNQVENRVSLVNLVDVMLPEKIKSLVQGVTGFHTMKTTIPEFKQTSIIAKEAGHASGYTSVGYSLAELVEAYNAKALPAATNTSVGIVTQGDMTQTITDLYLFAARSGFPLPRVEVVNPVGAVARSGATVVDKGALTGWNTATQAVLAAAGGALDQLVLYNVPALSDADLLMAYNQAVVDHRSRVVVLPFGACESSAYYSGYYEAAATIFQAAVVQGITFVAPVGRRSLTECEDKGMTLAIFREGELDFYAESALMFPATSPYVVAVGGTTLARTGMPVDGKPVRTGGQQDMAWRGTVGGASLHSAAPDWQVAYRWSQLGSQFASRDDAENEGVTGLRRRIPDLALHADPDAGAQILVNGKPEKVGGSGLSAALFAGFWSRIQSVHENRLHFPTPAMYMAKEWPGWFNDVTSGENGAHRAHAGWDNLSGFGSVDVALWSAGIAQAGAVPQQSLELVNTVPVTGVSIAKGGTALYRFSVPAKKQLVTSGASAWIRANEEFDSSIASTLSFRLSGGTGNGDMYVHPGGAPLPFSYFKKSDGRGNSETVRVSEPLSGMDYFVLITAPEQVRNATLVARYEVVSDGMRVLRRGEPVAEIQLSGGQSALYTIAVPQGRRNLTFRLSGGAGDGDLYAAVDRTPDVGTFDARSNGFGNEELITFAQPVAGRYQVLLRAFRNVRGASLVVDYD